MSTNRPLDRVAEILQQFVTSPPEGTPQEVVDALRGPVEQGEIPLPPRLFLEVVEQLTVSISITDRDANILYANPACRQLTGYGMEELYGRNQSMFSDKTTPIAVYKGLWSTITKGRSWSGILVNRTKTGGRYLADLTIVPVVEPDGEINFYLGLHRDVTEVNNLQKQLINQKALVESVVDAAPVAMALVDTEGRVVLDNLNYKSLMADMGREPAEVVLTHFCKSQGCTLSEAAREEREFRNFEVALEMGRGKAVRWFSCSGSWAHELELGAENYFEESDKQRGLLLVCSDITEQRRQVEADRHNAVRALLAEQATVQSMREVLEGAIFQLQGPLNVIGAAADMVERQDKGNNPLAGVLRQVLNEGWETLDRLREAVPDSPSEPTQSVNVNEAIRDVLGISTDRFLSRSAIVDWKPAMVLPNVLARPNALRGLVKSLLDNAMTAIDEPEAHGREILIRTQLSADGRVELIMEDAGPGISDEWRRKAFEPFASGWYRKHGHTGMGLAIAQQTISEQGGSIEIGNHDKGGCQVRVIFAPATKNAGQEVRRG